MLAELGRPDVRGADDEDFHRGRFEDYLARPDTLALVAAVRGGVVGFIDLEFRQRLNFREEQAWVPDLVVAESSRSRGAGKALLAEALGRARARGCWSLTLESASWRTRAPRVLRARGDEQQRGLLHQAPRRHGVAAQATLRRLPPEGDRNAST